MLKDKKSLTLFLIILIFPHISSSNGEEGYNQVNIEGVSTIVIESESYRQNKNSYCRKRSHPSEVIWDEDFSSGVLDKETWKYDVSNGFYDKGKFVYGWGNSELQFYRDAKTEQYTNENLFIEDGFLKIQPIHHRRAFQKEFDYTSARIKTRDLKQFTYPSKITFCFKVPTGTGAWPAFWLMPNEDIAWPQGGEIDIMEAKGRLTNIAGSALHFGEGFHNKDEIVQNVVIPPSVKFQEKFHSITMEWREGSIKMFLDSEVEPYMTVLSDDEAFGEFSYPFDRDYYLIINVAVGGKYDDYKIDRTAFCLNSKCSNKDKPDDHRFLIDWIEYARLEP